MHDRQTDGQLKYTFPIMLRTDTRTDKENHKVVLNYRVAFSRIAVKVR